MFKSKKFKAILPALLIIIVVVLFSFNNNVFSTEEVPNEVMPISEEANEIESNISEEEHTHTHDDSEIVGKDVYLLEDSNITVDYPIDGNLFVISNGTVTVTSEIGGSVFILAPNVIIEDTAMIYYTAYILAENLTFGAQITDLYSASSNLSISNTAIIYRDLHSFSETINFAGIIGRNASLSASTITLIPGSTEGTTGIIYGNLDYSSPNEITNIDKVVSGETYYTKTSVEGDTVSEPISTVIFNKVKSLFAYLLFVLAIWGVFKLLKSNYSTTSKQLLKTKPLPTFGIGLLSLIVIPVVAIILLLSEFTIRISAVLILAYIILLIVSTSIFLIAISEILSDKFGKFNKLLILIISTVALWLLGIIPAIGVFISFASLIFGLGIIILSLFPKNNSSTFEKYLIEENNKTEAITEEKNSEKNEEKLLENLIENITENEDENLTDNNDDTNNIE